MNEPKFLTKEEDDKITKKVTNLQKEFEKDEPRYNHGDSGKGLPEHGKFGGRMCYEKSYWIGFAFWLMQEKIK